MVRKRILVLTLLIGATSGVAACSGPAADPLAITVTQGNCGGTWKATGGVQTFQITNRDVNTTEVDLTDPKTGGVYAEVESLAPNTTRPMQVRLGHRAYAMRCYPNDNSAVSGPTVNVTTGASDGSPAVLPVSDEDLRGAVDAYDHYVTGGLSTLLAGVKTLDAVARQGSRTAAEAAWLTAHLDYNRLGAAYDSFGDFADAIDGLPDGLPLGVADPGFTGFHRIEYALWHGQPMSVVAASTKQLITDVAGLQSDFPKEQIDPNDLPLRAHEIMENAVQFQLTGHADEGSGTSLATVLANIEGTSQVLNAIAPVMSTRYAGWSNVSTWITTARNALTPLSRTPVADLTDSDRQRIDAACGGLLEALAPIAAIGDVRRTQ